jgi:hypothetical protein
VPLPVTVTGLPTVVPPLVQVVGGEACGPNTVNVTVPPAPLPAPVSVAPSALAAIATFVVLDAGTAIDVVLLARSETVVDGIPAPHVLLAGALFASPLYVAYHQ